MSSGKKTCYGLVKEIPTQGQNQSPLTAHSRHGEGYILVSMQPQGEYMQRIPGLPQEHNMLKTIQTTVVNEIKHFVN